VVIFQAIVNALAAAVDMRWEVLWPLALGFLRSALVPTLGSRNAVARTLGSDSPRSLGIATLLGAASSSCSYAAVAIARSLFLKGASFPAAMVFEFASTNLVFELGLILLILLGWPFLGAEFAGGVLMILILALLFRWTLRPQLVDEAREHADRGLRGRMEGHAAMDMAITEGPFLNRLFSGRSLTAISHNFWMDVTSVWTDIGLGLRIAGALAVWVPGSRRQGLVRAVGARRPPDGPALYAARHRAGSPCRDCTADRSDAELHERIERDLSRCDGAAWLAISPNRRARDASHDGGRVSQLGG